jgi:hypothetical protein
MGHRLIPGDRVSTPHGYGRLAAEQRDWSMGECDAGWHHDVGSGPPTLYRVLLDSGSEVTLGAGDVTRLAQAGTCDP